MHQRAKELLDWCHDFGNEPLTDDYGNLLACTSSFPVQARRDIKTWLMENQWPLDMWERLIK